MKIMLNQKQANQRKEIYETYITQINWDWLFFRSLMIFGSILFVGLVGFFLWMMP
ncbi:MULTISPECIES: hypothetical protein [Antarcticibacterium]|uniref:hypothetical protein n=1 Tax=Antarcticibacterium TaxID=2058174 RepID=UPI00143DF499|nr:MULTISPECIES: hypothetical protein [Antarcticibacterium]